MYVVIRRTASFISYSLFPLPSSPHLHKHPDAASQNVLAFSITFELVPLLPPVGITFLATRPYDALSSIISHHPLTPPLSHITGSWVIKAPSPIVISIFLFPSFPAINCFVCGLGIRHVYEYLSTLARSNTEYGKYAMQALIHFLPAGRSWCC